ncbi:MAG: hypothetical protein RL154_536 [Pseudomonadota bacterium]|jgi:flagellar biosynthesis protein FlhF
MASIKYFFGETAAEALQKAKDACGDEIEIVSTRKVRDKSLTHPAMYELLVKDPNGETPPPMPRKDDGVVANFSGLAKQMSDIDRVAQASHDKITAVLKKPELNTPSIAKQSSVDSMEFKQIADILEKLRENIGNISSMIWDSSEVMREGLSLPPEFAEIYRACKDSGMSNEHLHDIMQLTLQNMPSKMQQRPITVKRYFQALLRKLIAVRQETRIGGQKRIMMFVGPTGVGKTTTLAKLAARYAIRNDIKYKVGIITLDTYRIGAIEQLMQYARMMRLSIEQVSDPSKLKDALSALRGYDYILIDTVGSSQHDKDRIQKISKFLKSDSASDIDTSLVVSAGTKYEDLREIYANFSAEMDIDTIIVTKMDETKRFGDAFSLMLETKKPVSFFSIGQEVPDDLLPASSEFFIDCLMDGFNKARRGRQ